MTPACAICDTLSDAADWSLSIVLADPDTGVPVDITGSALKVTFRALADGAEIATCSTLANDGSLTITEPLAGKADVLVRASARTWTAPAVSGLRFALPVKVIGDVLRQPIAGSSAIIEGEARINLLILPSTTRW